MSVLYPTTMYVLYPPTHSKTKNFNQFLWFIMMGILCFFNYLQNQEIGWRVKRKKKILLERYSYDVDADEYFSQS
jgi:hypothetical protein